MDQSKAFSGNDADKEGGKDIKVESFDEDEDVISELRPIGSEAVPPPHDEPSAKPHSTLARAEGMEEGNGPGSSKPQMSSLLNKMYQAKAANIRLTSPDIQTARGSSVDSHGSKDSKDSLSFLSQQVSKATKAIISTVRKLGTIMRAIHGCFLVFASCRLAWLHRSNISNTSLAIQ
jgi:hypothetical protein